jgi:hypothetical protein
MGVAEGIAFFVPDCFEELINPDGCINSKALSVEGCEIRGASTGLDDSPKSVYTHGSRELSRSKMRLVHENSR